MYSIIKEKNEMIIVDLIKELMYQQNKSVADVAEGTGLSLLIITNIVEFDVIPTPEYAEIILNYLGITLEDVLTLY